MKRVRWSEYAIPALFGVLFLGVIGLIVVSAIGRKTVTIPAEYCQGTATGRTREQAITTYNCYGYDKNGVCTMNVPTTSYYSEKEVNVTCNYTEWQ